LPYHSQRRYSYLHRFRSTLKTAVILQFRFWPFLLSLLLYNIAFSQSGTVKTHQYTKADFNADAQFWAAIEGDDGTMYFGNNDGVLIFDGERWQKVILPNNSSVRSLCKDSNGIVFAGGYNEVGTVKKNGRGVYFYTSMIRNLQLDGQNIENIWSIHSLGNKMLFRSNREITVTQGKVATHLPATTSFLYSGLVSNQYYVQESNHGILRLDANARQFNLVFRAAQFSNEEVVSIIPGNSPNTLLVFTTQGSIYKANTETGEIQWYTNMFGSGSNDQVSGVIQQKAGDIYISTISSGIIRLNNNADTIAGPALVSGLTGSVTQTLYNSEDNNLWALQNNGLLYIDFKSPYTLLFDKASVYDALVHNGRFYLATTQGVYQAAYDSRNATVTSSFEKIPGLQGQAWSVQLLQGDIIVSHDTGLYEIEDNVAVKIGTISNFWKVTSIKNKDGWYLASHYNGVYLLEKQSGKWILHDKIKGFNESARDIIAADEPDSYWVCHGYQGIFKIHINADYNRVNAVDHYTTNNGLKNAFNVNVARWKGEVVFTTNTGIYTFNEQSNKFVPHKRLNAILDPIKNTRKLLQSGNRTWFVQDDEAGYFYTDASKPELFKDLFLNLKSTFNRGMECLFPLPDNKMLFGTTNGLFVYNISQNTESRGIKTLITQVSFYQNQKQGLLILNGTSQSLPNQTDILRFDFAAPKMTHGTQVQYSYILEDVDPGWSTWQNVPYKEYTHLRPGTYTFKVKSRNTAGLIGEVANYTFTIIPKWYETTIAYLVYGILLVLFVLGVRLLIKGRIRHERDKSEREAERSRKLLELELEQLKLQRDKEEIHRDKANLEEDVINKSKELANFTMLLVQKKDMFAEITTDLKQLKEHARNEESRKKLLEIFQKLDRHKIGEEYMEVFDVNFEKVHHNFFEKLKDMNPALTKRELRLCAFVKMNLTNKEISPLLGISLRGIENARYRIRKKLNVAGEDNFAAFLEKVSLDK
jgi:AraC family chitin signaling transcriptional activator